MALRKINEDNNNWISYTDLMTGFLIIFIILTLVMYFNLRNKVSELEITLSEYIKIEEIKSAINSLDTNYFKYDSIYKKHIVNVDVNYKTGSFDIRTLNKVKRNELVKVGKRIDLLLDKLNKDSITKKYNIKFLIVVEGQASKDFFPGNDVLSYKRALGLKELWINNGLDFSKRDNCELIIAGSGTGGVPREKKESKNKRFLIQIIPKIGIIDE